LHRPDAVVTIAVQEEMNRAGVVASLIDDRAIRQAVTVQGIGVERFEFALGGAVPGGTRTQTAARPAPSRAFCRELGDPWR